MNLKMLSENGLGSLVFCCCCCCSLSVLMTWCLSVPQVKAASATRRGHSFSIFSCLHKLLMSCICTYLLWPLFAARSPASPSLIRGTIFSLGKHTVTTHSFDCVLLLWCVWGNTQTFTLCSCMAAMMLYPRGCLWRVAYLYHLYGF